MGAHPHSKSGSIACLHEHSPRTSELAHKTFAGADTRDDSSACDALHDVFAVPRNEVTIIDDILLLWLELHRLLARLLEGSALYD